MRLARAASSAREVPTAPAPAGTVELEIANRQLEDMARLRREFLQNLSHEFATPMTPVVGYLRLLLNDMGYANDEIAVYDVGFGFWAFLVGIFVGGILYTRMGLKRSVLLALVLMCVSNLSFALLAAAGHSNLGLAAAAAAAPAAGQHAAAAAGHRRALAPKACTCRCGSGSDPD